MAISRIIFRPHGHDLLHAFGGFGDESVLSFLFKKPSEAIDGHNLRVHIEASFQCLEDQRGIGFEDIPFASGHRAHGGHEWIGNDNCSVGFSLIAEFQASVFVVKHAEVFNDGFFPFLNDQTHQVHASTGRVDMNGFFPLHNGHGAGRARSPCPMVGMRWRKGRLGRTKPFDLIRSCHLRGDGMLLPLAPALSIANR